jgi:putative transmembrane protein PGPGW
MERRRSRFHPRRILLFIAGLVCILAGIALAVLPGPLTIPPVLLGLYLWSLEFEFAAKFFDQFKEKGQQAWDQAKQRPIVSSLITGGGLVAAGLAVWSVSHFDLVDKARDAVGI